MDTTFFVGIFVGAIVSIIASFFANLYTDQLREFLSRRRQVRLSSKKTNELKTYAFVKSLKVGDPIALLELQGRRAQATILIILAVLGNTSALLFVADPSIDPKSTLRNFVIVSLVLMGAFCLTLAIAAYFSVVNTIKKAKELDQYERDIRTKWGADAI